MCEGSGRGVLVGLLLGTGVIIYHVIKVMNCFF